MAKSKWIYYKIKESALNKNPNLSVIDILADELECSQEDIVWVGNK